MNRKDINLLVENWRRFLVEGEEIIENYNEKIFGKFLLLNYGDIVRLEMNKSANTFISQKNSNFDMTDYAGDDFKVKKVYINDGDESKFPIVFCDLEDFVSHDGKIIKNVPCYSDVLSVITRMKQYHDLKVGDEFILKDIRPEDYYSNRGKIKNLQDLMGSTFKIVNTGKSLDAHGKELSGTKTAIVSPKGLEDDHIYFIIPLVDEFVEKLK